MTTPPLPDTPCVRVRLGYTFETASLAGSRFYLAYSGSAPTTANCTTLATDIGNAWADHLAAVVYSPITLDETDVLDIASDSGASAIVSMSHAGALSGVTLTGNTATNVEFEIARRYRGGKPRMYLPPSDASQLASIDTYTSGFIAAVNTGITAFFAEIEALTVGSMGTLKHVNLSYYKGFINVTNSSGRERAAPKYRDAALSDTVTGYSCKAVVGSQRRRRTATTI
jgi:hypothetical protein